LFYFFSDLFLFGLRFSMTIGSSVFQGTPDCGIVNHPEQAGLNRAVQRGDSGGTVISSWQLGH
jgi:hypothetical protein